MTARQIRPSGRSLSLLTLVWLLAAPAALAAPIGFVASSSGLAEIQHAGNAMWTPIALDGNILLGDTIGTQRNSFVGVCRYC